MKLLLIVTAVLEAATGLALLLIPSWTVSMLVGVPVDTSAGLVAGRIAGATLAAVAIACWQVRNGERGGPSTGIVRALLFYNFAAMVVLVYAGIRLESRSTLLWPAILLHLSLGVWCLLDLKFTYRKLAKV